MHPKQLRLLLVILGCVVAFLWSQFGPAGGSQTDANGIRPDAAVPSVASPAPGSAQAGSVAPAQPAAPDSRFGNRGFRNRDRLDEHFAKHGHEFGAPNAAAYLAMAQAVRDGPVGDDILEDIRPADGVVSRYQRSSGAFLAYDADGTIRTFFKPNDGERYYRRQLTRRPQ